MKTFATLALLAVPLLPVEGSAEVASKAARLLAPFHQAVRQAVDPWKDGRNANDLLTAAAKLADQHLPGLKGELHQLALLALKDLDLRNYDLTRYETRFRSDFDRNNDPSGSLTPMSPGMLINELWNPAKAALHFRKMSLARQLPPQAFGIHAARDRLAPPELYAVSIEPERPVIAIESGNELCLVNLEYTGAGFYTAISVRITTKKSK